MSVKLSEETLSKAKQIMGEVLHVDESKLIESAEFIADLGCDSLDIVELTMALEEEFDIEIPDEDVDGIKTVGAALACLEKHLR